MRRHDLAYLSPGTAFRFACGNADPGLAGRVRAWIDGGRPLVVARQSAGSAVVALGITFPAHDGRRRVGCLVERASLRRIQPPLPVSAGGRRLPAPIAAVLDRLDVGVSATGAHLGLFGSLAWEALTGETYRHADSDIDVICDLRTGDQLTACLAALDEADRHLPCRLDGEIRFPGGQAVAWREVAAALADPATPVLAKGAADVALVPLRHLLASLAARSAHA